MSTPFEDKKEEVLEEEDFEEGSTIFSVPEEKHDTVKKPRLLKKTLFGIGALAVLAAAIVAIVLLVAEITTDDGPDQQVVEEFVLGDYVIERDSVAADGTVTKIKVFNYDAFDKVKYNGKNMSLDFYAKRGETEESNTIWLESSIPQQYTSETTVEGIVEAALGFKYTRIISENSKDGADYGFDKPVYTIVITTNEGEEFTVTVGNQAPDQSGYYVTVSNNTKVYLVRSSYITELEVTDKMDLTKALSVQAFSETEGSAEYYNQGALAKFDHLYFTNSNLTKTYKFETVRKEDDISYNTYKIVEPFKRSANDVGIIPIIEMFSNGIDSKGLYSITKTDAELKKYGLDTPDVEASIKAGKQERTIKATLQSDGNYALVASDMDVILKVSAANITTANLSEKDLFSVFIFIETLADLSNFTIETDEKTHSFDIKTEKNENDANVVKQISINGGELTDSGELINYYYFLLGVTAINYEETDLTGKSPEATIRLTRKDGTVSYVIEYYKAQNGRYQVVSNGDQMGLIGSSSFKNIVKYANNVAEGKKYNS